MMSDALDKKILDLVADEEKTADEIMAVMGNEVGPKTINNRIKALINAGELTRLGVPGAPVTFIAAHPKPLTEEEVLYEIPVFVPTKATGLDDEIARLNQGIAAAEVLSKRSRPDDLADVINDIRNLSFGISGNAPVSAALLNKTVEYLERGYEL